MVIVINKARITRAARRADGDRPPWRERAAGGVEQCAYIAYLYQAHGLRTWSIMPAAHIQVVPVKGDIADGFCARKGRVQVESASVTIV